jgi:hypothetical protein
MPCCLPLSALQQRCLRVGVSRAPTRRRNYALILGASVLADRAADVRDAPALVAQRLGALLVCAVASLGLQASPEHALWASAYEFSWLGSLLRFDRSPYRFEKASARSHGIAARWEQEVSHEYSSTLVALCWRCGQAQ